MDSTKQKTNTKMVSNEELHVDVNHYRDEVNSVRHHLGNHEKGQRDLGEKINKLIEDFEERIDKLTEYFEK
jgi:predicted nuclease with TOPRIM domain